MNFFLLLLIIIFTPILTFGQTTQTFTEMPQPTVSFAQDVINFLRHEDAERFRRMFRGFVVSGGDLSSFAGLSATIPALDAVSDDGYAILQDDTFVTFAANRRTYVFADPLNSRNPEIVATGGTGCTFSQRHTRFILIDCALGSDRPVLNVEGPIPLFGTDSDGTTVTNSFDLRNFHPIFPDTEVSVHLFGMTGDGQTNDAPALQSAINVAQVLGLKLKFAARTYRLNSPVVINQGGVVFECVGFSPSKNQIGFFSGERGNGSWFLIDNIGFTPISITGAGRLDIRNCGFTQEHPEPADGWTPTNYPYIIDQNGEDLIARNIMFYKVNRGIRAEHGRMIIDGLWGHFFINVIHIEAVLDVVRMENFHIWPWWSIDSRVGDYMKANLRVIDMYKVDGPMISNFFVIWAREGISIRENEWGTTHGGLANNIFCDQVFACVFIETTTTHSAGINITNITMRHDSPPPTGSYGIYITANVAYLQITNLNCTTMDGSCVHIGDGGSQVSIVNASLADFNRSDAGFPGIVSTDPNNHILAEGVRCLFTSTPCFGGDGYFQLTQFGVPTTHSSSSQDTVTSEVSIGTITANNAPSGTIVEIQWTAAIAWNCSAGNVGLGSLRIRKDSAVGPVIADFPIGVQAPSDSAFGYEKPVSVQTADANPASVGQIYHLTIHKSSGGCTLQYSNRFGFARRY